MENILKHHSSLHLTQFLPELAKIITTQREFLSNAKGSPLKYRKALDNLPDINIADASYLLNKDRVTIGQKEDIRKQDKSNIEIEDESNMEIEDESNIAIEDKSNIEIEDKSNMEIEDEIGNGIIIENIKSNLMQLAPWRKGPFELFGIKIDSEWQSWIKWNRFIDKIMPLKNRAVLDIGSSNGYYMFRMKDYNPKMVLGLEPQYAFYFQYLALQKYLKIENIFCLPIPFDELPCMTNYFDTVFCMGVIYHRKSPLDMLNKIREIMKQNGELILETLIIESDDHICLFPEDRYAKMRNVFFIPSIKVVESWLKRSCFKNIKILDISKTEHEEQRKTEWIQTESLTDFLDPENPLKTVEGYPAPVRAVVSAQAV